MFLFDNRWARGGYVQWIYPIFPACQTPHSCHATNHSWFTVDPTNPLSLFCCLCWFNCARKNDLLIILRLDACYGKELGIDKVSLWIGSKTCPLAAWCTVLICLVRNDHVLIDHPAGAPRGRSKSGSDNTLCLVPPFAVLLQWKLPSDYREGVLIARNFRNLRLHIQEQ